MSGASEAFSAREAVESGRWDRHLFALGLAVQMRMEVLGTSIRKESLRLYEESLLVREDTGSRTEADAAGFEQYRAEASGEADAYRAERRDAAAP